MDLKFIFRTTTLLLLTCFARVALAGNPLPQIEFFEGVKKANIAYRIFPASRPKATIVLLPGMGQSHEFFLEMIEEFNKRHFSVFAMDLRGMGRSTRLASNPKVIHVENFQDYKEDFKKFVNDIVTVHPSVKDKPILFYAHSTGAMVNLETAEELKGIWSGMILSSPLIKPNYGNLWEFMVQLALMFGQESNYVPGYRDKTLADLAFSNQRATQDRGRYETQAEYIKQNPSLLMGGPSRGWLKNIIKTSEKLRSRQFGGMQPIMMLQAGSDLRVDNNAQTKLCEMMRSQGVDCQLKVCPNSFHEIYREIDEIRGPMLRALFEFADKIRSN
jgi:lysophospholipase